ncbi:MAG: efflux RND transporter periplasmic adaptor subunit, partial [Cyanobacteriota bacterium]
TLVGALEADRASAITAEGEGRVTAILVQEGDIVLQGQVLMTLDDQSLQTERQQAQADLARNRAALAELEAGSRSEDIAGARANLQAAQARLTNAKKGSSPEEIAQAQAQIRAAEAEAELAQERVRRFQKLRDEGVVSLDSYDQQLKEQRQALANLESAQRRLSQLQKSRGAEIESLGAEVEQSRQALSRLERGARPEEIARARAAVQESQARLDTLQVSLQKRNIQAPFSGAVGAIPVKVGDYVQAGETLTTLTENQSLDVNLQVPLDLAPQLRRGLAVQLLNAQGKAKATGQISFIAANVDSDAQTVLAKASFTNPGANLLNQQLVEARILWNRQTGLLAPTTAVSRIGGETFVYVVQEGKDKKTGKPQLVAQQRPVTLGPLQGNRYQVKTGLEPGERVITSGLVNLQDGAAIINADAPKAP